MANHIGEIIGSIIVLLIICLKFYETILHSRRHRQRILDVNVHHTDENQIKLAKKKKLRRRLPSKVWEEADHSDTVEVDLENPSERQQQGSKATIAQVMEEISEPDDNMSKINNNNTVNGKSSKKGNTKNECLICLLNFEDGCSTCYSNNPLCSHIFHHECMLEWLLQHDECPCCRAQYLIETV